MPTRQLDLSTAYHLWHASPVSRWPIHKGTISPDPAGIAQANEWLLGPMNDAAVHIVNIISHHRNAPPHPMLYLSRQPDAHREAVSKFFRIQFHSTVVLHHPLCLPEYPVPLSLWSTWREQTELTACGSHTSSSSPVSGSLSLLLLIQYHSGHALIAHTAVK